MKKSLTLFLVFALAVSLGLAFPASGQEKAKETGLFTIARAVVGTGVENSEPVGVAEAFPASTERVYCFIEATNISKDTEISFTWFCGDKEMLKFNLPLKAGSKWRTFANKNLRGMKGDWKVEIKDAEGKLVKDVKFKVE